MHQRIAVQAFQCGPRQQSTGARGAEQRGAFHQQEWAQSFSAAEHGMAHGREQALRPRDFARAGRGAEQAFQQRFGIGRD